jgi:hypothetical protein
MRHDGSPERDSNSDVLSRVFSAAVVIVQRASRHRHCFDTSTSLPRLRAVTLIDRPRLMRAHRQLWYRHVQACFRVSAAHCARVMRRDLKRGAGAPQARAQVRPSKEGAGNAGCPLHPRPRVVIKNTRVSHHRFTGSPGTPCAMVLTVSFALSLVTGLCCHHPQRDA